MRGRAACALMESKRKFVGALGRSIMEGAAPMLDSLIKANMEQITIKEYRYQRGGMEVQKVEVKIQVCLYFCISVFSENQLKHYPVKLDVGTK